MAAEAAAAAMAPQSVSAQIVGNAFVQQYYQIQHTSPELVYRFYQDISKLGRPEEDGSMSITTTMQGINEKIVSLNYADFRAEIKTVDSQESFDGGFNVLVTGYLTGKDDRVHNFAQSFFLAPQDKGYFVLNDMFRYVDVADVPQGIDVAVPRTPEPIPAPPVLENHVPPVLENHVPEQSPPAEEPLVEEVYDPPQNGVVPIVEEEEVPVAEVVDEVHPVGDVVVESSAKVEDAPRKSYASIVMHLKESAGSFSPAPVAPRRAPPKKVVQVAPTAVPAADGPVATAESVEGNNHEGEDGYSIYLKGLPMNATVSMLDEVFKKFGTIKPDGIQVRSNKQQQFCFGFVEYEEASSVLKALEASPVAIGTRQQVFIEEKKSSNSRGNNRGRFQSGGRGPGGFRNEGGRGGRGGNYGGGGRSFNNGSNTNGNRNGDFNNGNRGSNNRGSYQKSESNGGARMSRNGGLGNGNARNMSPQVSATA